MNSMSWKIENDYMITFPHKSFSKPERDAEYAKRLLSVIQQFDFKERMGDSPVTKPTTKDSKTGQGIG